MRLAPRGVFGWNARVKRRRMRERSPGSCIGEGEPEPRAGAPLEVTRSDEIFLFDVVRSSVSITTLCMAVVMASSRWSPALEGRIRLIPGVNHPCQSSRLPERALR